MAMINTFKTLSALLAVALLLFTSCHDQWEQHYIKASTVKMDKTLIEAIQENDSLSVFSYMLEVTGYDTLLATSQSFTVWAPVNSALNGVDLADTTLINGLVQNHIARFNYPSARISALRIFGESKKYIWFKGLNGSYIYGNSSLLQLETGYRNGLLYLVDNYLTYQPNLWEFMADNSMVDSIGKFFYSNDELKFNPSSLVIGTSADGQTLYDSTFIKGNSIIDLVGELNNEDSLYTMLVPTNKAWSSARNLVSNFYKSGINDGGVAKQKYLTGKTICENLVFRDLPLNPELLDSVLSTTGTYLSNPAELFDTPNRITLSNGVVYLTDTFNIIPTDAWNRIIKVEAERKRGRVEANFEGFSTRGNKDSVSNGEYLLLESTGKSISTPYVEFEVPKTLSTKYNIYCVFLPFTVINPLYHRSSEVRFKFYYTNESGKVKNVTITPDNNVTSPNAITKMFIGQFELPVCNIPGKDETTVAPYVRLRIESRVKYQSQTEALTTNLLIDCIILEPVL